jgi:hypothetical protein
MFAPFVVRLLKDDYCKILQKLKPIHPVRHLIVMITINPTGGIYPCQAKIKKNCQLRFFILCRRLEIIADKRSTRFGRSPDGSFPSDTLFNVIRASIGADINSGWKEKTYDERKSGNHLFPQHLQPL